MTPTSVRRLIAIFLAVAAIGWFLLSLAESRGSYMTIVPWPVAVVLLGMTILVLTMGWRVRSYLKGRRPGLESRHAVRTLILAQTSAYGGTLLGGWYGAQALTALRDWSIEPRREKAIMALIAVGLAVMLAIAGLIVERWCRITGDTEQPGDGYQGGQPA